MWLPVKNSFMAEMSKSIAKEILTDKTFATATKIWT